MKLLTWKLFGWDWKIPKKEFKWELKRPVPPKGYILYSYKKQKCPNCGAEKAGYSSGGHTGFQDREIQNILRMTNRLEERYNYGEDNWKCDYDLFSIDLIPERDKYDSMLKCHPSRYDTGSFSCCGAKIWHDFYDESEDKRMPSWNYYYLPIGQKTLGDF